ncbi:MAG: xanthine dehydrogenase small subunit [Rhodothermales bacterium]|jgi:xanthine dehydrogenase small subunit
MTRPLHFILNDREVKAEVPAGQLVLDYLRESRRMVGTKEGCREGDCGACVVLVGELQGDAVRYRSITSCLMPAHELASKHLVTIEALRGARLTAVQEAIITEGGSQCGFCTPGIVLSLTGALMERSAPLDAAAVKTTLGGHLCRCTGYRSLKAVGDHLVGMPLGLKGMVDGGELPAWFSGIPERLAAIVAEAPTPARPASPASPASARRYAVAGGTDLYVQQGDAIATSSSIEVLGTREDLRGIRSESKALILGPATTFEEMAESKDLQAVIPRIRDYMDDIASVQIRNRATVGGNLVNASPIGDVTILLLALDTTLTLESDSGSTRRVALRDFYLGYKELDLSDDELLTSISISRPAQGSRISWEKVAKRRTLDIASVNGALVIRDEGGVIQEATLTAGGVAATPFFLAKTSAWLRDRPISAQTVVEAAALAQTEVTPISDIRGTAAYKRLLLRQLIWAHFQTLYPELISFEALYREAA